MQDTSYSWKKAARNKRTVFVTMLQLGKKKKPKASTLTSYVFQVLCYLLHFFPTTVVLREFAYHKFICLKYAIQWFVVYSQLSNHHHDRNSRTFSLSIKPCTISSQYPFSPSPQPWATTNLSFLSLWICLFWTSLTTYIFREPNRRDNNYSPEFWLPWWLRQ